MSFGSPLFRHTRETGIYPGFFWSCRHKKDGRWVFPIIFSAHANSIPVRSIRFTIASPAARTRKEPAVPRRLHFLCTGFRRCGTEISDPKLVSYFFRRSLQIQKIWLCELLASNYWLKKKFNRIFLNEICKFKFLGISMYEDNSGNYQKYPNYYSE